MNSEPGDWMDEDGACKVCGGEIPHGHSLACHIYKQERAIARLTTELEEVTRENLRLIQARMRLYAELLKEIERLQNVCRKAGISSLDGTALPRETITP